MSASTWPEAQVLAEPRKGQIEPRVLVKRNCHLLLGPRDQEVISLPGPAAISLFTGAGGFDLGIEQAGFCTVVQHEWDENACETLIANRPRYFRHAALIQGDIRETPTSMILREGNLRTGEAHLLVGGPPCQGFSTSGKRDPDDIRNTLVFEYLRVIREAQPKFFSMENVPGFQSLAKGRFLEDFLSLAYDSYYELVYGIVNAVEYGVPQIRNRFICMGTRRDLYEIDGTLASLPRPTHHDRGDLAVIQNEAGLFGVHSGFESKQVRLLTFPPGVRYFPDRPVLATPLPCLSDGRTSNFLAFYERLMVEEPDRLPVLQEELAHAS